MSCYKDSMEHQKAIYNTTSPKEYFHYLRVDFLAWLGFFSFFFLWNLKFQIPKDKVFLCRPQDFLFCIQAFSHLVSKALGIKTLKLGVKALKYFYNFKNSNKYTQLEKV